VLSLGEANAATAYTNPVDPGGVVEDSQIALSFSLGTVSGSESKSVTYYTSFNVEDENGSIIGTSGQDMLVGPYGDDDMFGGDGYDIMLGFDGNDTMIGGAGDDDLYGHEGNDVLTGDGDDVASNERGWDYFIFRPGDGDDIIMDYTYEAEGEQDLIDLRAYRSEDVFGTGDLTSTVVNGTDLLIEIGMTDDSILLKNVSSITQVDFWFASMA
jgi:Ca2+-binding RTX toxin-like protein